MEFTDQDECPYCGLERHHFNTAKAWKTHVQECFEDQPRPNKARHGQVRKVTE